MKEESIFDGTVTLKIPDSYERWNGDTQQSDDTEETTASQTSVDDDPYNAQFIQNLAPNGLFRARADTYVTGSISQNPWQPDKLSERLNDYYQTAMRSLPMVRNAEIGTRPASHDKETQEIGMLHYTFATPTSDWFACTILLPVDAKEATLTMLCTFDHAIVGAMEFMSIADSVTLNQLSPAQE
ncbi:hypothetical protein OZX67_00790 [Bifidobacterium sp. ESL0728]|uniref:hypothetical protein n=1 Tax=Bifidobacterium sp. ESL0728 TaxID=2983220 RepID=UPI0023F87620|nr:hypothetical protein [Bifidobacterium sp. ESL0728]WEV59144.1 hypothetical protein OZX67_00790 [Bifidobacterium sp. ESL0728]